MIFSKKFEMGLKDVNRKNELNNKSLLEFLENIAAKHSDAVGLGMNDIQKTKLTWVLLEWKLEVIKRPKYGDILDINTWARYSNKCYSYRDFEVYDQNNNKCAIATSKWLLIDIDRGRPTRIEEELISKYEPEYGKSVFNITELDKLKESENYKSEKIYEVRRSDIDINGHMHNLNYLDLVYDILPQEQYDNEANNIRISYKKEIRYGNKVRYTYLSEDNKDNIIIKSEDGKNIHAIVECY